MKRREFITLLGGAAAWPLAARAQQPGRTCRLAFFVPFGRDLPGVAAFFDELRSGGFIEGQNLTVGSDGFNVRGEQIAELAAAVVNWMPDAIFTGPDGYTRAIQKMAGAIPVIALSGDMVGAGLVASLSKPGGNTTGVSMFAPELDDKRQEMLIEAVPRLHRIGVMADPTMSQTTPQHLQELRDTARAHGIDVLIFTVTKSDEIVPAIERAKAAEAEALNFLATPVFIANRRIVLERVAMVRLPAIYQWPEMTQDGGLMAYGPRTTEVYRQVARLAAKVLRGVKAADLPVEQPTKFELSVNLKTAKVLGCSRAPTR